MLIPDLVQRASLKVSDVLSYKNAVTIAGAESDQKAGAEEFTPFLSIVDPKNCTMLAHTNFNILDRKTISAFGDFRVSALTLSASNGALNDTVSFTVLEHACQYDLLHNRFSFDCSPVGGSAAESEFIPTYTDVEKRVIKNLEPAFVRTMLRGDLDGDGSPESVFFVRPKVYSERIQPEKVVVADSVGHVIGVWETPTQVFAELIADIDGDGKDEVLVRSDGQNETIEVLGFKR